MSQTALKFLILFVLGVCSIKYLIFISLRKKLLDIPNERSSHTVPKPRLGGIGIVLSFLIGFIFFNSEYFSFSILACFLFFLIGLIDDITSLSPFIRLGLQILISLLISITFFPFENNFGYYLGTLLMIFWVVGCVNAYNFMDGIDGIAGVEAVSICLSWILYAYFLRYSEISSLPIIILPCVCAFLIFNWNPSKIFMGDGGSYFLGSFFALLPIMICSKTGLAFEKIMPMAVVSLFPFILDSFLTFTLRLIRRENPLTPHREHLYQKLYIKGFSPQIISIIYGLTSIILSLTYILIIKLC
ncbi:MAG: hypothetical protein C0412_21115 [Flavobacterium sp.]|nr:hypothetical protein [Flavobacterium sp.]